MIAALIEVVELQAGSRPTVSQILSRARVSRVTFYRLFHDYEDCFLAAFDEICGQARTLAVEAYAREDSWEDGIRSALGSLLALMDERPGMAQLCIVDSLAAGERVRLRREELMQELIEAVDLGRRDAKRGDALPEITGEVVVGGVVAIVHRRIAQRDQEELTELVAPLMATVVLPYLGPRAASEQQRKPYRGGRDQREPPRPPESDPLGGLRMRLTYRTVRVLVALTEHPGASNREVGKAAGIQDQGQISKLLGRLAHLDLIENLGAGQPLGGANAWQLTPRGERLVQATRPRLG